MKVLGGPVAVLEPSEAERLLIAARHGTEPLRAAQGALPAGVDQALEVLAGPSPVLSGDQAALVAALVRAGGVDVAGLLRELDAVAREWRDRARIAGQRVNPKSARASFGTEHLDGECWWLTTTEAASECGLAPSTVRRAAARGAIMARPAAKGTGREVEQKSLMTWCATRRGPGRPRRMDQGDAPEEQAGEAA